MFKSKFQILYNSLYGGLDANTQQYVSIQPPVKTKFEAKYIIHMIATVTNAWRSYQLLSKTIDVDHFTLSMFRKQLRNSGMPLQEFNYNLAITLICSSTNPSFLNGIIQATSNEQAMHIASDCIDISYSTLRDRIHNQLVPLKY
jgi:CRISPR/Cas system endoribonuclease Cas6 (RAMP superfamily)